MLRNNKLATRLMAAENTIRELELGNSKMKQRLIKVEEELKSISELSDSLAMYILKGDIVKRALAQHRHEL